MASLCRSFLLADRVMLAYNRHVVSEPKLPSLHDHPLWDAWDFTLDHCLDRMHGAALQNSNVLWSLGKELYFVRTSLRYNGLFLGICEIKVGREKLDGDDEVNLPNVSCKVYFALLFFLKF